VKEALLRAASSTRSRAARREAASVLRAAFSSFVATVTDGAFYELALFATTKAGHGSYAGAAILGAIAGGVANLTLNRRWAFRATHASLLSQSAWYAAGSMMTLLVLEAMLWILVDRLGFDARAAWLPAKIVTWAAFSYPFQRVVVYAGATR
jgi:putative flippase GtrA